MVLGTKQEFVGKPQELVLGAPRVGLGSLKYFTLKAAIKLTPHKYFSFQRLHDKSVKNGGPPSGGPKNGLHLLT